MKIVRGVLLLVAVVADGGGACDAGQPFGDEACLRRCDRRRGAITLQGTGATFPAPLYQKWFTEYNKAHPEVQINYQALGSGAG